MVEEGKLPQTPMNYDTASYQIYVAYLEAENAELTRKARQLTEENAALRERLDKAVELKKPYLEEDHYGGLYLVHYETVVHKIKAYEERAAAETRLRELQDNGTD